MMRSIALSTRRRYIALKGTPEQDNIVEVLFIALFGSTSHKKASCQNLSEECRNLRKNYN